MPLNSGYNPGVPIGQPYGLSGPASLPGTPSSSPFGSLPLAGGSPFSSSQQSQLQNALSAAGIWDGVSQIGKDVWDALSKLNIDWSDVGSWIKNNIGTVEKVVGLVGGIKGAFDAAGRQAKSDQYAKDALAGAQKTYDAKEPLRLAGQSGMLNPQANAPDLSTLKTQGQSTLSLAAPTPLPLATPNLANAQHLANGPGSSNPFTKTLPIASPAAPPSLPRPAVGVPPIAPGAPTPPLGPSLPMAPPGQIYRPPQTGRIRMSGY